MVMKGIIKGFFKGHFKLLNWSWLNVTEEDNDSPFTQDGSFQLLNSQKYQTTTIHHASIIYNTVDKGFNR